MNDIDKDLPMDTNRDIASPEEGFIKGREDSADNIEQSILSRAEGLDQSAPGSVAEMNHMHTEATSYDKIGDRNLSPQDIEEIKKQVDQDAMKQTGKPTGAIYGANGDNMTVNNTPSDQ